MLRYWNALRAVYWLLVSFCASLTTQDVGAETVALWLFDEPSAAYPSTVLNDATGKGNVLILGRGAQLAAGRFGNALMPIDAPPLEMSGRLVAWGQLEAALGRAESTERSAARLFGLVPLAPPPGRKMVPLTWRNATFSALATVGEKHLRSGGFPNPTQSGVNLGPNDWTIEFWLCVTEMQEGVVFEVGTGPRGENELVTQLFVQPARSAFRLANQPAQGAVSIASQVAADSTWRHYAFVHDASRREIRHYVNGVLQSTPAAVQMQALPQGDEAYISVARDGLWQRPLPGKLDELRFSDVQVYKDTFVPQSHSVVHQDAAVAPRLLAGPPLLFREGAPGPYELGTRKHLFLDAALIADRQNVAFVPNPPRRMERVLEHAPGHLTIVDDEQGLLRLYYQGPDDTLAVMTSRDGIHWDKPNLGRAGALEPNTVCGRRVGLGTVFIDPNAPPRQRWKYVSGIRRQGIFVFTSADGWWFEPHETAALPFSAGSQSAVYYDDQRRLYAAHHRSDYGAMASGSTRRRFVLSEVQDLLRPWPFVPATPARSREFSLQQRSHIDVVEPWFLDNGPLAPCGFSIELPTAFAADEHDPEGTDIYVTKASKYAWAPDAYVAFPTMYFHYWDVGPETRQTLGKRERERGSGVTEVQLAVSRDGLNWQRYRRPAYAPIGGTGENDVHMLFMAQGIAKRGNELWQFVGGHGGNGIGYHSSWVKGSPHPLWRLVQRLDGFVAAEGGYEGGSLTTKPLTFTGGGLHLNIDTGAVGDQPVPTTAVKSEISFGADEVMTSDPVAVTRMLSSMRTPIPR